jgi:hypothetical protein
MVAQVSLRRLPAHQLLDPVVVVVLEVVRRLRVVPVAAAMGRGTLVQMV